MNRSFKNTAAGITLAATFCLVSCQENTPIAPDTVAASKTATDDITSTIPKKYTLTKIGPVTLAYLGDGRLHKVTQGVDVRGEVADHMDYSYGAQWIKATTYAGSKIFMEITFQLDAKGRCFESERVDYMYIPSGFITTESRAVYAYNDKGQLKTVADKNNAANYDSYSFDANGDLSKVTRYYNGAGAVLQDTYAYEIPTGDPLLVDRYPLNPGGFIVPPDPYLPIFGKKSKHLMKRVTQKSLPSQQALSDNVFAYTLNADGYVTQRQEFTITNAALVETKKYDYLVTTIGLSL